MTEQQAKWARENYNLHQAQEEYKKINPTINPAGKLYRSMIKSIETKYQVTL